MKLVGNKQHACLSAIVMAALILVGLNAYQFMSLEQQPLVGYSRTIKTLQAKLQQFDRRLAAGDFAQNHRFNLLGVALSSPIKQGSTDDQSNSDPQKGSQHLVAKVTGLPALSGIMQMTGPGGAVRLQAILNGRLCSAKDTIAGFTIEKISPQGIVVRQSGRKWTIECPTPYFSCDRGK